MNTAFIKHIEDTLPLTQNTLITLCDYLEATGWTRISERHYSKVLDGSEPVQVRVPASSTQPTPTDAVEAVAEIISLLSLSKPLEELLSDIKARTEQVQGPNEFRTHHTLTRINEAGVVVVDSPDNYGICVRLEPKDALRHAEYLLAHRAELELLQQQLEQTWREVALEVKQHFETEDQDGATFADAAPSEIHAILEKLSGRDASGYTYIREPEGQAGRWYRSLWTEDLSDSITYEQQWTPFLRELRDLDDEEDRDTPYDDRTAPRDFDPIRYQ